MTLRRLMKKVPEAMVAGQRQLREDADANPEIQKLLRGKTDVSVVRMLGYVIGAFCDVPKRRANPGSCPVAHFNSGYGSASGPAFHLAHAILAEYELHRGGRLIRDSWDRAQPFKVTRVVVDGSAFGALAALLAKAISGDVEVVGDLGAVVATQSALAANSSGSRTEMLSIQRLNGAKD